uniref:Uncharacterized protein n=1 Tax=Anguilla anguilla TaxID=7936 RepID=A0A0E9Q2L6_ANGAN
MTYRQCFVCMSKLSYFV